MGKKDKKKVKGAEKTSMKTEKKLNQKIKKELAAKGEDDIDMLLAHFAKEDKKKMSVIEELVPPPSKRSAFSLSPHPDKDQLILFGGEYFNGNKTFVYGDLFTYDIKKDKWLKITSPGSPPPRSAHQAVTLSQDGGQLWIFGGEFTSPSQAQFHHYKDLWVFHFKTKKWEKISATGGPSARSGHRMVVVKKKIIVFGGFHDNSREFKYFSDVHAFDLENYEWKKLEVSGNGPCPRSGCQMVSTSEGKVLVYGGYSKERVKKDLDQGIVHSDMFFLAPDKHDQTGLKWKWQTIKQSGMKPSPRCGFSLAPMGNDRAVLFGGVYDEEEDEEIEGYFHNDLHLLDIQKTCWYEMAVTSKKDAEKKKRRKKEDDEEVEGQMEKMKVEEESQEEENVTSDGVFTVTIGPSHSKSEVTSVKKGDDDDDSADVFTPPPRMNAGLVVKKGIMFLYGGMYEEGDKQLTLNDFYALDLNKMDEWHTIIALNPSDMEWFDSDSEEDDEDDSEDDEEDDDDDDGAMDTD